MKIHDFEQYSDEWYAIRLGKPTASAFDKIVTTKGEPSKSRQKYLYRLAGEFVAGKAEETYQNAAMARGLELEAEARKLYEFKHNTEVQQVGFCESDGGTYGASPDGLVGEKGNIEIKCPIASTHVGYMLNPSLLLKEYFQQVHGQMFVAEREWTDLLSYYPSLRSVEIRVYRDEDFIEKLEKELKLFCFELKKIVDKIS